MNRKRKALENQACSHVLNQNLWPGGEADDARRKDATVVVVEVAAQSSGDRLHLYRYGQINAFNAMD